MKKFDIILIYLPCSSLTVRTVRSLEKRRTKLSGIFPPSLIVSRESRASRITSWKRRCEFSFKLLRFYTLNKYDILIRSQVWNLSCPNINLFLECIMLLDHIPGKKTFPVSYNLPTYHLLNVSLKTLPLLILNNNIP